MYITIINSSNISSNVESVENMEELLKTVKFNSTFNVNNMLM